MFTLTVTKRRCNHNGEPKTMISIGVALPGGNLIDPYVLTVPGYACVPRDAIVDLQEMLKHALEDELVEGELKREIDA